MSDPKRWLDDPGSATGFERDLLRGARDVEPPQGAHGAVWKALAAQLVVGGAVGVAGAAGTAGTASAASAASSAGAAAGAGSTAAAGAAATNGVVVASAGGAAVGGAAASGAAVTGAAAAGATSAATLAAVAGASAAPAAVAAGSTAAGVSAGIFGLAGVKALVIVGVVGTGAATYVAVSPPASHESTSDAAHVAMVASAGVRPAAPLEHGQGHTGVASPQTVAEAPELAPVDVELPEASDPASPAPADAPAPQATARPAAGDARPAPASAAGASGPDRKAAASAKPVDAEAEARAEAARLAAEERASRLAAESARLTAARQTLRRGDAAGAVTMLGDIARDFPGGRLAEERESLLIEALVRSGKTAAARQRAAAFLRAYPKSLAAQRVKQIAE
jgi:hypothetical protein